jgi:hypothetical protein
MVEDTDILHRGMDIKQIGVQPVHMPRTVGRS